jgi:hypothetical protein
MTLISDFLLATGAFATALYCFILARRLKRFTTLETGMGGAIAVLSIQVDDMTRALDNAQASTTSSSSALDEQVRRAEAAAARLELMLAALHDLPKDAVTPDAFKQNDAGQEDRRPRFVRRRPDRSRARATQ